VYEENPTISYVPVTGSRYVKQVFAPVSVAVLAELTSTLADPGYVFAALIAGANGMLNPDFVQDAAGPDPDFERFIGLMTTLTKAHRLYWAGDAHEPGRYSIVIDHYAPDFTSEVAELLTLLGLEVPPDPASRVVLPVYLALDGGESDGIGIATRSVGDLAEILAAAIEVPAEDERRGLAAPYPPPGLAGRHLRVRYSDERPRNASVAVPYREGWYFIDETDRETKRFFRLLSALWSVSIAEGTAHAAGTPVLTVPVSR
jgi:hypothetical protein